MDQVSEADDLQESSFVVNSVPSIGSF